MWVTDRLEPARASRTNGVPLPRSVFISCPLLPSFTHSSSSCCSHPVQVERAELAHRQHGREEDRGEVPRPALSAHAGLQAAADGAQLVAAFSLLLCRAPPGTSSVACSRRSLAASSLFPAASKGPSSFSCVRRFLNLLSQRCWRAERTRELQVE
jgi:hypothetical protein